jgi:hypothetical protein
MFRITFSFCGKTLSPHKCNFRIFQFDERHNRETECGVERITDNCQKQYPLHLDEWLSQRLTGQFMTTSSYMDE